MKAILGQIFGWLAALFTVISYQCKTQKKFLAVSTLACLSICMSYLFLEAYSGMTLNIICIFRNFIFQSKKIKFFSYKFWPWLLAVVMGAMGALSWQGPVSLLIIIALMINTVFMSFENVQTLRKSILLTSSMIAVYNVFCHTWGGVFNELLAISSACVGLYRFRQQKTPKAKAQN